MNKAHEIVNKRNLRVFIGAVFLFLIIIFMPYFISGKVNVPPEKQNWRFGTAPKKSSSFGQCDATEDCLYFSYWGTDSRVDVYEHDGSFLYSIEFEDINNGRVYIRCENDLLYIKLRNNNVFVFMGKEMVAQMSETEADAQGFTNSWFDDERSRLIVEDGSLYFLGEAGQIPRPVAVPAQITIPPDFIDFGQEVNGLIVGICAILVISYFFFHIFRKR